MKRGWLTSLLALSGIMLTMWQWLRSRSNAGMMAGKMAGQWLNMQSISRIVQEMTRMVKRRSGFDGDGSSMSSEPVGCDSVTTQA